MKYRLAVVDIDGTLVNKNGEIAEEDKQAIRRISRSGVTVCLCTGRIIQTSSAIIAELGLDNPHILYDGSLIYIPKGSIEVKSWPIDPRIVKKAIEFSRANDIYLELYSNQYFFAEKPNWSDDIHRNFFHIEPTMVNFDDIWNKEKILKAEIIIHNNIEADKAKAFKKHFGKGLRYSIARSPGFPGIDFINILNPSASKGEALKNLANFLGVHQCEILAIGDGLNDISLLSEAAISVAMGNAFPEVKETAKYITLDIDHHGLAAAIDFFFPG